MALVGQTETLALLEIFVFLAVAELLHSFAEKAALPNLISDILLGIVLSSFAVGGILNGIIGAPIFVVNDYVILFADFSVILLLFAAGLGSGFSGLTSAGKYAVLGAVAGDLVPFVATFVVFSHFYSTPAALLLGVAAAATSSAVVASLLRSEGRTSTTAGQFHMNLAALDDVVALVLLSVALTIVGGQFNALAVTGGVVELVVAWLVLLLVSVFLIPRVLRVPRLRDTRAMPFLFLFLLVTVVVALRFSAIIGAFIAGIAVAESLVASRTQAITEFLLVVFGSLFFVVTGAEFDFHSLASLGLLALSVVMTVIALAGKVGGVYPFARLRLGKGGARAVTVGMIPRGEIGLIVGSVGFASGVLDQAMLGEILLMSVLTTLIGALWFRREARSARTGSGAASPPGVTPVPEGSRGKLR